MVFQLGEAKTTGRVAPSALGRLIFLVITFVEQEIA